MINLDILIKLLEDAMPSEDGVFSIDEKIMSKKQARKLKLRKKRRAEKKAQQKKAEEQEKQAEETSKEEIEDFGSNELIVYENPTEDEYDQVSEDFQPHIAKLKNLLETHQQEVFDAMKKWESAGKDKPCPPEVWDLLNASITNLKNNVAQEVQTIDVEKLADPEIQILDRYMTGLEGYIEKVTQQVMAIKPNLVEDDFKAPVAQDSTEMTTTTQTTTTGTGLVPAQSTALTTTSTSVDVTPLIDDDDEEDKDKRKKKKLVDYEGFMKNFSSWQKALKGLIDGLGNILKAIINGAKAIVGLASNVADFLNDNLFNFLTSPLARDFVKSLMYTNPITAMIFDGDFGKIDLAGNIHNKAKSILNKGKNLGKDSFKNMLKDKSKYDDRTFPKDLDNKTLKELRRDFYSNKNIVDCINVSYNHPEVNINYKSQLKREVDNITKAFKDKKIEAARKSFQKIIRILNDVCDSMDWKLPRDWKWFVKYIKAKGHTTKEWKKIEDKSKEKVKEEPQLIPKDQMDDFAKRVAAEMRKQQKQESYSVVSKLERLLEEAER